MFCFVFFFISERTFQTKTKTETRGCVNSIRPAKFVLVPISKPTFSVSSFISFIRRTLSSQDGNGLIYRLLESEGPLRRDTRHPSLNAVQFPEALKDRPPTFTIFHFPGDYLLSLPPSFPTFHLSPLPPFFSGFNPLDHFLFMWLFFYRPKVKKKHNKGKVKVRPEKMQQLSVFLTDDVCNPGSLTIHRNNCFFK